MIYCIDNTAMDEFTVTAHPRERVYCVAGWESPGSLEFLEGHLSQTQLDEVTEILEKAYPMENW